MNRGQLVRLSPCGHCFHKECRRQSPSLSQCPICRGSVESEEEIERRVNRQSSPQDRGRILEAAAKGEDWVALCSTLGVKYSTAYSWVRSGRYATVFVSFFNFSLIIIYSCRSTVKKRGGAKPKKLDANTVEEVLNWIGNDCTITLKAIQEKLFTEHNLRIGVSTISNYLENELVTFKQVHKISANMNSAGNKAARKEYLTALSEYTRTGKTIIWIDETNFNLFCRRTHGRSLAGTRAVINLPASRGPNVHVIGAISAGNIISFTVKRGSFTANEANTWLQDVLSSLSRFNILASETVVVADNAPCHSRLNVEASNHGALILKLGPYSPMLNPVETLWSKLKAHVKSNLSVPSVSGTALGEQRLQYLESAINNGIATLTNDDCARAAHHTTTFYPKVNALEDIAPGS